MTGFKLTPDRHS